MIQNEKCHFYIFLQKKLLLKHTKTVHMCCFFFNIFFKNMISFNKLYPESIYDPYMNHQTFQTIAGNKIQGLRFWNSQGHQDEIP